MKGSKLLFHFRHLSSTQHVLHVNSFQQRCLIHTCLPLMNQEKSTQKKESNRSGQFDEQPHMRTEAKAEAEERGMYISTFSVY